MNKNRKIFLYIGGGITGLMILLFLVTYLYNDKYRSRIPEIPVSSTISPVVEEQISEALKKARFKPSAKNLGELGMVFHSSANYNQAAQCYQLAIEQDKTDWKWNYYLGYLYKELGESEKAAQNFERVVELNPDADLAWYYIGEAYRNLRKTELSEKAFTRIANKNNTYNETENARTDNFPLSVYAMFEMSNLYVDNGRPELAQETINKLLGKSDVFGPAYRVLASIYFMKNDKAMGERFSARANDLLLATAPLDALIDKLSLMSRSELFLLKMIDEAKNSGYYDWVLTLVQQGLKYMPQNEHLVIKAVDVYLLKNFNQEAASLASNHFNSFADKYPALMSLGFMFFKKGIYPEAIKYWSQALKLQTDEVDIYKNLAMCYWKTGERNRIREVLSAAANLNENNSENLADIIVTFIQFEEKDKAAEYLKKLNKNAPQGPRIQKLYGKIAENNGDLTTAISMYESSFKGNPKDTETIYFLGNLLFNKKIWSKYIRFYEEVIRHFPNSPEYLEKLSAFYISSPDVALRNFDEGIIYSIRAFSHKFSNPSIKLSAGRNLAIALATKGDKKNSLSILQKTINVSQDASITQNVKQELQQLYQTIQNL